MLVLSLCSQLCPDKLPVKVGQRLGDGADGETLEMEDDPSKVIKLGILYDGQYPDFHSHFKQIQGVLQYMIVTQPGPYVRVYEQGYLGTYSRSMPAWENGTQSFILYYYIMDKLRKITEDERKVFHSILSHEDRGIAKHFSTTQIREMLVGMNRGLDFDPEKVILFCASLAASDITHQDLHPRNIMRNHDGDFKAIDLDRCSIE